MDGERVDYEFRLRSQYKRISQKEWSSLLERVSKIEQELERKKNGEIHSHHADGGPS